MTTTPDAACTVALFTGRVAVAAEPVVTDEIKAEPLMFMVNVSVDWTMLPKSS